MIAAVILNGCAGSGDIGISSAPTKHSREEAARWHGFVAAGQRAILEDGVIDLAEYKRALTAGARCMTQAGFEVSELQTLPDRIRMDFTVYEGQRTADDLSVEWHACRQDNYGVVEGIWLLQHVQPDRGVVKEAFGDCLAEASVQEGAEMADADLVEHLLAIDAPSEAWLCREVFLITSGDMTVLPPEGPGD